MKQQLVVLTGAGISAESGIKTFRDSGGLWEDYDIYEVATPEGWAKNKALVLDFYNKRRKQLLEVKPNNAHYKLAELEKHFDVHIITQNVDDLHERAGSSKILHLHGELLKSRSTVDPSLIYDVKNHEINIGDKCEKGSQLRPHIVWFGEAVPAMEEAFLIAQKADIFLVVGTSLQVYPAAGLVDYFSNNIPKYIVDPNEVHVNGNKNITIIKQKASVGMEEVWEKLVGLKG